MTRRKAEALTGYEVRRLWSSKDAFRYGAFQGEQLVSEAEHTTERIALTRLVNDIYRMHSRRVLDQHGWRCGRCGSSYRIQIHHRTFRSHGGTHRIENLEPLCSDCHRSAHHRNGFQN